MNSKIKNTILEGILIGTLALNGCCPEIEIKAKVIGAKFIISSNSYSYGTGYIIAQDGTKPYAIKLNKFNSNEALSTYDFETKIKEGDSISFKNASTRSLEDIKLIYRPRANSRTEDNIIYTK